MTTATLDVIRLDHGQEWIVCSEGCLVEALQEAQATGEYRATCIMDREDLWVCCHCSACGERIAAPCQLCDFELYYENGERCSELSRIRLNSDYAEVCVKPRNRGLACVGGVR